MGGVCAGLADYWNTKPNYVRILFILAALLFNIITIGIYIICWISMPRQFVLAEKRQNFAEDNPADLPKKNNDYGTILLLIGIACIGVSMGPVYFLEKGSDNSTLAGIWMMITIIPAAGVFLVGLVAAIIQMVKK
ncbi:MAG: phage shock protein PspC (stress-responsive transcriptional regulator) [Cyclobacteriaceae bacterium]